MRTKGLKVVPGGGKKSHRVWRGLFIVGVVLLAVFLLWNSLGYLALWAAEVTVATASEVSLNISVQCFVLREQSLLRAPAAGEWQPQKHNGDKVSKGETVASLGGAESIKAPAAGLILYNLDGFEERFALDSPLDLSLVESVAQYFHALPKPQPASQAQAGELVGVIVKNTGFKLVTGLDFHSPGLQRRIEAEDGATYRIVPREVLETGNRFWVLWDTIPLLSDALAKKRVFEGRFIDQKQEAVMVSAKALCTKGGAKGVIVLFRGKPLFNEVEVVCFQGKEVGVTGLAHGQRVLTMPWWASLVKWWWLK